MRSGLLLETEEPGKNQQRYTNKQWSRNKSADSTVASAAHSYVQLFVIDRLSSAGYPFKLPHHGEKGQWSETESNTVSPYTNVAS